MKLLSILICTVPKRQDFFQALMRELRKQIHSLNAWDTVDIDSNDRTDWSIGKKRNFLLEQAEGKYIAFIDDDDRVSTNYIKLLLEGIATSPDCCSLVGEITEDGKNTKVFLHSIRHDSYYERDNIYYRYPNHLNCVKADIAKQFKFPNSNHGEDTDFATQMHKAGVLKKEYDITQTIYYYDYRSKKPELA